MMRKLLMLPIRFYQKFISPCFPRRCPFEPTCSQYCYEAIGRFGALKGGWMGVKRLCRCNPFYKGIYFDPVPEKDTTGENAPSVIRTTK